MKTEYENLCKDLGNIWNFRLEGNTIYAKGVIGGNGWRGGEWFVWKVMSEE